METVTQAYLKDQVPPTQGGLIPISLLLNPQNTVHSHESRSPGEFSYTLQMQDSGFPPDGDQSCSSDYYPSPGNSPKGRWDCYHCSNPNETSAAMGHVRSNLAQLDKDPGSNREQCSQCGNSHHIFPSTQSMNLIGQLYPKQFSSQMSYDVISHSSSREHNQQRPPRQKYEEEELYFIWYYRVGLRQDWKDVYQNFNHQFPNRQRRGIQGIQGKFYRLVKQRGVSGIQKERSFAAAKSIPRERTTVKAETEAPLFGASEWADMQGSHTKL